MSLLERKAGWIAVLLVVLVGGALYAGFYFGFGKSEFDRQFPQFSDMSIADIEVLAGEADEAKAEAINKAIAAAEAAAELEAIAAGDDLDEAELERAEAAAERAADAAERAAEAAEEVEDEFFDKTEVINARHYLGLLHLSGAYPGPDKFPGAEYVSAEALEEADEIIDDFFDAGTDWAIGVGVAVSATALGLDLGASAIAGAVVAGLSKLIKSNWRKWVRMFGDATGLRPNIGQAYWATVKTTSDSEAAVWWWRGASKNGYSESQYWLGQAYRYGYGVELNEAKAKRLICIAAKTVEAAEFACNELQ